MPEKRRARRTAPRSILRNEGFTLLEVLVALVLMAAVTLAAAMALRLAADAHERIEAEGDGRQVLTVLPTVLAKQLALVRILGDNGQLQAPGTSQQSAAKTVGARLGDTKENPFLDFIGTDRYLSFLTTYSRQGSAYQGITWVQYVYDEGEKTLSIYQQTITKIENDVGDSASRRGRKAREAFEPELVGRIERVNRFELAYTEDPEADPADSDAWVNAWEGAELFDLTEIGFPAQISLVMEMGDERGRKGGRWVFPVGYSIHFPG